MKIQKVLVVDDQLSIQVGIERAVRMVFGADTVVFVAGNYSDAKSAFLLNGHDLDIILMDTNLGNGITTYSLVEYIHQAGFKGIMVRPLLMKFHVVQCS